MVTTIQISPELREALKEKRIFDKETYEEVIWNLMEDLMELSEETKKNILESEKDIKEGRIFSHEEVKKRLGL